MVKATFQLLTWQCGPNFYDDVQFVLHLMESIHVFNTKMRCFLFIISYPPSFTYSKEFYFMTCLDESQPDNAHEVYVFSFK